MVIVYLKKGVPSAVGSRTHTGSGEGKIAHRPYPHKYAEAGARTLDQLVTGGKTLPLAPGPPFADIDLRTQKNYYYN